MDGRMKYEPVIGLEVHAQLNTRTKIFCSCANAFGGEPNTHVCPVCLGMPGVLPVLNKTVVEYAMRMALATDCTINRESRFARKNYFYPDLPKNYQISQYELPIAEHGQVIITLDDGVTKRIGITRIHMEEDAGKLIHDSARPVSRVDYNRTGTPLIEIVSEPDMRSPEEAGAYLRQVRSILRYLGISDGNMEEGSFRCDANVSLRPWGTETLGTRAELKNLNSFKYVESALAYEIRRQESLLEEGQTVIQETRLWDSAKNRSFSMRGKEEAHDYRYFPDPDLTPLIIDDAWIETIRQTLPELPDARKDRFINEYSLPPYDAGVLTSAKELADYFEDCVRQINNPKLVSNWVMGSLLGLLNAEGKTIEQSPVSASQLAELLTLMETGVISGKIAKTVFDEMVASGKSPKVIVEEKGLVQVTDSSEISAVVDRVIAASPGEVEKFKAGNTKLMGFFVGQVMKETKGKANPEIVNRLLKEKLG
jgi:aspartyl-tRNA(Asn)/glutamyl-tRNA(Gln) amidotransferase subunit B